MTFATSDLHGYPLDAFLCLLDRAGFGADDPLYVLGDVVDRNGDGGVQLLRWMMDQPNVELLLGNHEAMLLSCAFLFDEVTQKGIHRLNDENMQLLVQWMRSGGDCTIDGLRRLKETDPLALYDLLDYLRDAPLYTAVTAGGRDFLLVHAGLGNFSPEKKLHQYTADELLWHRPTSDETYFPHVMTILGHTPTGRWFGQRGRMFQTSTWIDIDTGAGSGGHPMVLRLDDLRAQYGG